MTLKKIVKSGDLLVNLAISVEIFELCFDALLKFCLRKMTLYLIMKLTGVKRKSNVRGHIKWLLGSPVQ